MNYEEKYNQAIEAAKRELRCCGSLDCDAAKQIFRLFPELKESEDERIREELLDYLKRFIPHTDMDLVKKSKVWIAWLEKQGEQKPEENKGNIRGISPNWSEEDEKMCQETIDWFEKKCFPYALESENPARESIKWLKSLKDRVQPKQEWSEGDRTLQDSSISYLCNLRDTFEAKGWNKEQIQECINWLKSLKPNHWKPSEEQMQALETAIRCRTMPWEQLGTLYNDLKKLM